MSVLPLVSLARWLTLLSVLFAAAYLAQQYNLREYIEINRLVGLFILGLAVAVVIKFPDVGIMNYYTIEGAWRGIFWHKNHFGIFVSFVNILIFVEIAQAFLYKIEWRKIFVWVPFYLFSLAALVYSDSVASYLTSVILHGLVLLIFIYIKVREKLNRKHYVFAAVFLFLIMTTFFFNLEFVFGKFNRNTSLTGRIPMWEFVFERYISERALGGYGLNAFWQVDSYKIAVQQAAGYPDPIVIADNGFVDVLINTGYLGLGLFLIFYVGLWWRSIKYMLHKKDFLSFFPIVFLAYTLLANITWSLIYESESFFFLLMLSLFFLISKEELSKEKTHL